MSQAVAPAFVAPPVTLAVQPDALSLLPGLVLSDPEAIALAASGQGKSQILEILLTVGAGILRLQALDITAGIIAAGQGSGSVSLIFTADEIGAVNAALAGLAYDGPGGTTLNYRMSNLSGPLGATAVFGQVALDATGNPGADEILAAATLTLSGTSVEFGLVSASALDVTGTAIFAAGAAISGAISLAAGTLLDFAGTLTAQVIGLPAGAVLTGSGTLDAGSIGGPGTLLAAGGDTLVIAGASLSAGANLIIGGGGLLALGTASVASAVTLGFEPGYGVASIAGGAADSLSQDGGVIVITDPLQFQGSITGFEPGDRLLFPDLTGLRVTAIGSQSFVVTGTGSANLPEQFTLHAAIPAGTTLAVGTDKAGDAEIGLRAAGAEMFVGGASFAAATIDASAGIGQSLQGLQLLLPDWTSQSLILTLSVAEGVLSYGSTAPAASLVLDAASPAALNLLLSEMRYTAGLSATADTLVASSNTGLLAGLSGSAGIVILPGGGVAGFAAAPSAEQTAIFAGSPDAVFVTAAAAPGAISVSEVVDFADILSAGGIGGTALVVDGSGIAMFDAAAGVKLAASATIGNAGGAGTLGIATAAFAIGSAAQTANLIVGGNSAAAASAVEVTGALSIAGDLVLGQQAASRLDVSGTLGATGSTIGAAGTLTASGNATAAFGDLTDAGTLFLQDAAQATAGQVVLSGQMTLGGSATLSGLSSAVIAAGGALVVGPNAVLDAFGLQALGGSVLDQGSISVSGNLVSAAMTTLDGGLLSAAAATFGSGAVLMGSGELRATGTGAKIVLAGEILAQGGTLALDGSVSMGGGGIVIAGTSVLDLMLGATGGDISFAGAGAVLTIDDFAQLSGTVSGMVAGDVIDLTGIAPSLVSDTDGTIATGTAVGFVLDAAAGQPAVTIISDDDGGALLTLGGEAACFARGTRLLTPNGYVPVEAFRPGDPIVTRLGIRRAVCWIGWRDVETQAERRQDMRPVVILPGAFGPLQPARPVRLSPAHAVFIDGVLVPVMHLVNGATILRERKHRAVTYFHLELDRHEVLMADGLAVESYIDTGNRGEFQHWLGRRGNARQLCAPLLAGGVKLARIRRRLHEIALQAGFTLAHAPELRAIAGALTLIPEMRGHAAVFQLPAGAKTLLLLARSAAPAETDPGSDDRRQLAICLRQPRAGRQKLRLGAGWYGKAPGDKGIWMGDSGEVFPPAGATELTLTLQAVAQSWRRPAGGAFATVDLDGAAF